ncbi:MAG: AFG1 family ATPase, partial [Alphaproteobacteria bacterium]|nr:AFG1 family ATPase [Alphaproteobacteria bacterium]
MNQSHQPQTLTEAYLAKIAAGDLSQDPAQAAAVARIQTFADNMQAFWTAKPSLWDRLTRTSPLPETGGFYLHGAVGRGKSMLMDLFYATIAAPGKRRVHFHQFMLEVHSRLHALQEKHVGDILPTLAQEIAKDTRLLCFDEFHVSNIADAMILGRLFTGLFDAGVVVFTTSNWAPEDLYKDGLQRDRFLPFIDLIRDKMLVHEIVSPTDYRYRQAMQSPCYWHPTGRQTTQQLENLFHDLTGGQKTEQIILSVQGRSLTLPRCANDVGFIEFDALCRHALSAADYLEITKTLKTVVIDHVPHFEEADVNALMRFVTLIDTFYEAKMQLFLGLAAAPEQLHTPRMQRKIFERTLSRLMEMQSDAYRS